MQLLTEELKKKLPPLYNTEEVPVEEKVFVCKFFTPWTSWTWYVVEGQQQEDGDWLFFGYVEGMDNEWGNFCLSELESIEGPAGLKIERDLYFENVKVSMILRQDSK